VIHDFHLTSGATPNGGMVFDSAGNLYGTTFLGGYTAEVCNSDVPLPGCGLVFKLTPGSTGGWTYNVVKTFKGLPGGRPYAGLTLDGSGNIYGTTTGYATNNINFGTVFKITP
jgi:hypothetical protein